MRESENCFLLIFFPLFFNFLNNLFQQLQQVVSLTLVHILIIPVITIVVLIIVTVILYRMGYLDEVIFRVNLKFCEAYYHFKPPVKSLNSSDVISYLKEKKQPIVTEVKDSIPIASFSEQYRFLSQLPKNYYRIIYALLYNRENILEPEDVDLYQDLKRYFAPTGLLEFFLIPLIYLLGEKIPSFYNKIDDFISWIINLIILLKERQSITIHESSYEIGEVGERVCIYVMAVGRQEVILYEGILRDIISKMKLRKENKLLIIIGIGTKALDNLLTLDDAVKEFLNFNYMTLAKVDGVLRNRIAFHAFYSDFKAPLPLFLVRGKRQTKTLKIRPIPKEVESSFKNISPCIITSLKKNADFIEVDYIS